MDSTQKRPFIEKIELGDELSLRLLSVQDADDLFQIVSANQNYFSRFEFLAPKIHSPLEAKSLVTHLVQKQESGSAASYGLWDNGSLVGLFKINHINWLELSADVGYWLTDRSTGKGFAQIALNALVDICWRNLDLKLVVAYTAASNLKSQALLEKVGFKKIKLIKDAVQINGKSVDDFMYQLDRI